VFRTIRKERFHIMKNGSITATLVLVALVACAPADRRGQNADPETMTVQHDDISYRAESQILERDPATVRTTATVVNTSGDHREITFPDGCTVLIVAYGDEGRQTPAWEQERIAVCTLALQIVQLGPGEWVTEQRINAFARSHGLQWGIVRAEDGQQTQGDLENWSSGPVRRAVEEPRRPSDDMEPIETGVHKGQLQATYAYPINVDVKGKAEPQPRALVFVKFFTESDVENVRAAMRNIERLALLAGALLPAAWRLARR
jgi:hypothetical protein